MSSDAWVPQRFVCVLGWMLFGDLKQQQGFHWVDDEENPQHSLHFQRINSTLMHLPHPTQSRVHLNVAQDCAGVCFYVWSFLNGVCPHPMYLHLSSNFSHKKHKFDCFFFWKWLLFITEVSRQHKTSYRSTNRPHVEKENVFFNHRNKSFKKWQCYK